MKPQASKTTATPKGKSKTTEKPKTGKGKAATTNASGKARAAADPPAPPPMNTKKVAKAPAVALKSLEKITNETENVAKKAVGTKRQAPPASGSSSSVASKKVRSNAPAAAQQTKPGTKAATPTVADPAPTFHKKLRVLLKKTSTATLETVKEEDVEEKEKEKAEAAMTKKPAAKPTKLAPKPQAKNPKKLLLRGKGAGSKKKVWQRFVLDCSCLVEDQLMDLSHLEKYIKTHIKVNQRINNLGDLVNFERPKNTTLVINSSVHFAKRYFKYLTKRYLKKNCLRDWVRMVSTSKDTFTMRYFKFQDDDDDVIDMKE